MLTWAFSLGELIMLIGSTLFFNELKTEQKVQCSYLKKAHDMLRGNELCRLFCTNKEFKAL